VPTSDPLDEPDDGTPLAEQERQGLLLPVLTRKELNSAEAENISQAMTWLFLSRRRLRPGSVARETWLQSLHRRMCRNGLRYGEGQHPRIYTWLPCPP